MHKRLFVLGSTFATAGAMAIAVACGDSNTGSVFDGSGNDGGEPSWDSGGTLTTDGTAPGQEGGPVDCNPRLSATFKPEFKPPVKSTDCTPEQLAAYFDVCVDPLDVPACKAWREDDANKACTRCVEPEDLSGPIQQHLNRTYQTFNVAGCLSIKRSETTEGTCAVAYWNAIQCFRDSCTDCPKVTGATFSDVLKCQAEARSTACKGYLDKVFASTGGVCPQGYAGPDAGAYECFQHASSDKKKTGETCADPNTGAPCREHYIRAMGVFCGPSL